MPFTAFSSPVSAPLPRTRERVALRDLVTRISTESILANDDGGLRPRALGDEGGDVAVALPVLRGLASERRLRLGPEAGVTGTAGAAFTLSALLLPPPSLSCPRPRPERPERGGARTRTRDRDCDRPRAGVLAGVDVAVAAAPIIIISALGFARALPLVLVVLFGPSAPTPRAISAMPVSSVPSEPPSSLLSSSGGGRARLVRPLALAPAPVPAVAFGSRARMLRQFSWRQESSLSSACVASARNLARLASVCDAAKKQRRYQHMQIVVSEMVD